MRWKINPYAYFKKQKQGYIQNLYVTNNKTGWMSIENFINWFKSQILPFLRKIDLIVFDDCTIHLISEFLNFLDEGNIKFFIIPSECTGLLQPLVLE